MKPWQWFLVAVVAYVWLSKRITRGITGEGVDTAFLYEPTPADRIASPGTGR